MKSHETFTSNFAEMKAVSPMLDPLNGDNKYPANDICKMIEFLMDNIYVRFGGQLFRQMIGILMGTKCAPLLPDWFLYSYENGFLDKIIEVQIKCCFSSRIWKSSTIRKMAIYQFLISLLALEL